MKNKKFLSLRIDEERNRRKQRNIKSILNDGRGQIWIETVLYTLIGLSLIGIVLAIVTPKINEYKDRMVVEQTIESLNVLDSKINEVLERGSGNVRIIPELVIRKGELEIQGEGDSIVFYLKEMKKPYSEPGVSIDYGRIKIISEQNKKTSDITLRLNYTDIANITYNGKDLSKRFNAGAIPYRISIKNTGKVSAGNYVEVSLDEISGG